MKFILILLAISTLSSSQCSNKKSRTTTPTPQDEQTSSTGDLPVCIRKMIDESNKEIPPNPPLQIDAYMYKGKKVYLFTMDCCDQFNMVYDDSCRSICAPSGGITGRGDGKCPDFDSTAKHLKMVWKKPSK